MNAHDTRWHEERAKRDAEYHDRIYATREANYPLDINPVMFQKYSHPKDMTDWRQLGAKLLGDLQGKRILDYGCGVGEECLYFAKLGADVYGTEVSKKAIELATKRAAHHHVADRIKLFLATGIRLNFEDNFFDLVHGMGVLHHVGLEALEEIHRVLKPDGKAVFLEHMMSSKKLVPALQRWLNAPKRVDFDYGTGTEMPLDVHELPQACSSFKMVKVYPYHILYRLRRYFPSWTHPALLDIDYLFLKLFPFLERYAGGAVILLTKSRTPFPL